MYASSDEYRKAVIAPPRRASAVACANASSASAARITKPIGPKRSSPYRAPAASPADTPSSNGVRVRACGNSGWTEVADSRSTWPPRAPASRSSSTKVGVAGDWMAARMPPARFGSDAIAAIAAASRAPNSSAETRPESVAMPVAGT
jgi:hypothetical protein